MTDARPLPERDWLAAQKLNDLALKRKHDRIRQRLAELMGDSRWAQHHALRTIWEIERFLHAEGQDIQANFVKGTMANALARLRYYLAAKLLEVEDLRRLSPATRGYLVGDGAEGLAGEVS
jgi:hypothetical protein